MDGSRFDGMARSLAAATNRRHALSGAAATAFAGLLAHHVGTDVAAACVRAGQRGCDGPRNRKCCQGATCRGGSLRKEGKCKCQRGFRKCAGTCANTKTDKNHCGGCKKKCLGGSACKNGVCTSRLGCTAAKDACVDRPTGSCPGNPDCACLVGTNGAPYCSDATAGGCSTCTTNDDCPGNQVCVVANGCGCPDGPGSGTGNLCVNPTCQGVG